MVVQVSNTRTYQCGPRNFNAATDITTSLESREEIILHDAFLVITRPRFTVVDAIAVKEIVLIKMVSTHTIQVWIGREECC